MSRQARAALEPHVQILGADRLEKIFTGTDFQHVRRQTLLLIDRLSKWQKVPLLIEISGGSEEPIRGMAENFLQTWLTNFNKTHQVPPTGWEIKRLHSAMQRHGAKLPGPLGNEIRAISESLFDHSGV